MVDQPSSKPLSNPFGRVFAVATALSPCAVLAGAVMVLNPGAQFERGLSSAAAVEGRMMAAAYSWRKIRAGCHCQPHI